jgi:ABC-2 type transport system ATP-binding protein
MPASATQSDPVIDVTGITKRFGGKTVVDAIDLQVRRGEIFGFLGPNGSGKTTFIRLLSGYLLPTSGRLEICGCDAVEQSLQARRMIGYVPESAPVYGYMRVREFLAFMARLRGMTGRAVSDAVDRVITALALQAVADRPTRALSRGFRQRTAIAQALVHDPEFLILDEPANGLDPRQIIEVRDLIRGLGGRHTVLMSSHVLGEVAKTADRVGVLLDGRLRGVRAMADTPDLEAWFLSLA